MGGLEIPKLRELWRPLLIFSHVLLIVLVMMTTMDDRQWNLQQSHMIPSPGPYKLLNCSHGSWKTPCCRPNVLRNLVRLYDSGKIPRELYFINIMIYGSSLTVMLCLLSSLVEMAFFRRINSKLWGHRTVNKIAAISYIFCLYLLSRGISDMSEQTPKERLLCGKNPGQSLPKEATLINFCYRSMGICRDPDSLVLVLICMIFYPMLCLFGYYLAGTCALFWDIKSRNNNLYKSRIFRRSQSSPSILRLPTRIPKTNIPQSVVVPIHASPADSNSQARVQSQQQLHNLLHLLARDGSCRHDENYLSMLARSFKNYIRSGNTPRIGINPIPASSEKSMINYSAVVVGNPIGAGGINKGSTLIKDSPPSYEKILVEDLVKAFKSTENPV